MLQVSFLFLEKIEKDCPALEGLIYFNSELENLISDKQIKNGDLKHSDLLLYNKFATIERIAHMIGVLVHHDIAMQIITIMISRLQIAMLGYELYSHILFPYYIIF